MKRYAFKALERWRDDPLHKPLLIQGVRQAGKTWLMKEFGRQAYAQTAYLSFSDSPLAQEIFQTNFTVPDLIHAINAYLKMKIDPANTLLIFDEIQDCTEALHALKIFAENAPQYSILAAGSLLGVALRYKRISFPVGQVDFLRLHPMGFGEFLEAIGEENLADLIFHPRPHPIKALHEKFKALLKQYMAVGGMPEAVATFAATHDWEKVRLVQKRILESWGNDFNKYTQRAETLRIIKAWNSIPRQLARENKKFTYQIIDKDARAREYKLPLDWLFAAGLAHQVNRITKPDLPLKGYEDSASFKLYFCDIGLLGAAANLDPSVILEGSKIFEEFKGAFTEQYVLQELKLQPDFSINYWKANNAEVDFVIQHKREIIPLEVKASTNLRAKSLASYIQRYHPPRAVRTSLAPWEIHHGLADVPLYLIENLPAFWA